MVKKVHNKGSVKTEHQNPLIPFFFRICPLLLILILGIIIYSNSFDCSFHFDDNEKIIENKAIRDIGNVKALWNFMNRRFIGYSTFALNYHFHQLDVFGYHLFNLAIHIITSFLVWWLADLLLSTSVMRKESISKHKHWIALGCGLFFVSHPLQTQAITYIIQRLASLATLFYAASLCFYIKARLSEKKYSAFFFFIGSATTALLGMFTKEIVFTLPIAIVLSEFSFFHTGNLKDFFKNRVKLLYIVIPLLFILIIPALLSFNLQEFFRSTQSQRSQDPLLTSPVYLMTQFRVIVTYIRFLFLPLNQNIDHDFPASQSFFEPSTFISFLFLTSLFFIAVWLFPRKRFSVFGIFLFFLTLSVESSLKPLHNVFFEHRVYLPMIGFSLFLVSTLYYLLRGKHIKIFVIILCVILGCNSFLAYRRNSVWKDDISLWSDALKKSPNKARPYYNLGIAMYKKRNIEEAKNLYHAALNINPNHTNARNNLGEVFLYQRKFDEAIREYREVLRIDPDFYQAHNNTGNALLFQGKFEEAVQEYKKALKINPNYARAYNNLGKALTFQGKLKEAVQAYQEALLLKPGYVMAHKNLGEVHYLLGVSLKEHGKAKEAIEHLREALRINPDNSKARAHLKEAEQLIR